MIQILDCVLLFVLIKRGWQQLMKLSYFVRNLMGFLKALYSEHLTVLI